MLSPLLLSHILEVIARAVEALILPHPHKIRADVAVLLVLLAAASPDLQGLRRGLVDGAAPPQDPGRRPEDLPTVHGIKLRFGPVKRNPLLPALPLHRVHHLVGVREFHAGVPEYHHIVGLGQGPPDQVQEHQAVLPPAERHVKKPELLLQLCLIVVIDPLRRHLLQQGQPHPVLLYHPGQIHRQKLGSVRNGLHLASLLHLAKGLQDRCLIQGSPLHLRDDGSPVPVCAGLRPEIRDLHLPVVGPVPVHSDKIHLPGIYGPGLVGVHHGIVIQQDNSAGCLVIPICIQMLSSSLIYDRLRLYDHLAGRVGAPRDVSAALQKAADIVRVQRNGRRRHRLRHHIRIALKAPVRRIDGPRVHVVDREAVKPVFFAEPAAKALQQI